MRSDTGRQAPHAPSEARRAREALDKIRVASVKV